MPPEALERKLTAILSADVAGYSLLMRDDEEATVRTLTDYRRAMASLIQQYRGRVVDSPGDNLLAEFASVVDAVNKYQRCSITHRASISRSESRGLIHEETVVIWRQKNRFASGGCIQEDDNGSRGA